MKYRAEIDGLRALAVIPVILFHAGFQLFKGGFVGVDIFFVISGYLITLIICEEIEDKKFSLVNFYERRARRILPALFFVVFVCIPFAWMWMLPSQLKDFSESLFAVSLFASNILFFRESSYFAAVAEEKPLLHTWSLAVEEQYYVLFPLFLMLAWRLGKNRVFWIVVLMAAVSLLISEWGWRNKPTANFYLAPSRAWELLAGSIAAFIVQRRGVCKNNVLALLGLAGVLFAMFAYDESTPFPSLFSLVPVLGVVLLVLYAGKGTYVANLLSTKAFVGIGLISYSAYLWHQPLFAFLKIHFTVETAPMFFLVASLGSLALAFFTWKFIETPFRNRNKINRQLIFSFSILGTLLLVSLGLIGHFREGFPQRYNNNLAWIEATEKLKPNFGLSASCERNFIEGGVCATSQNPGDTRMGDSYAMHLLSGIISSNKDVRLQQATVSQCAPILEYAVTSAIYGADNCIAFNRAVYQYLSKSSVKYVVLASPFARLQDNRNVVDSSGRVHSNGAEITRKSLLSLIDSIRNMGKIPVVFTPPPVNGSNLGDCLLRRKLNGRSLGGCDFKRDEIHPHKLIVLRLLQETTNAHLVDLTNMICDTKTCHASLDGVFLFRDNGHLSIQRKPQARGKIQFLSAYRFESVT